MHGLSVGNDEHRGELMDVKVRAWDKEAKRFVNGGVWFDNTTMQLECIPAITMSLFTGLHDKNGKEIWADDVITNCSGRLCKVVWHDGTGSWDASVIVDGGLYGNSQGFECREWKQFVEVIGNIWENEELIKKEG